MEMEIANRHRYGYRDTHNIGPSKNSATNSALLISPAPTASSICPTVLTIAS